MRRFLETLRDRANLVVWRCWYAVLDRLPGQSRTTVTVDPIPGSTTLILAKGDRTLGIVVLDHIEWAYNQGITVVFRDLATVKMERSLDGRRPSFEELMAEAERRRRDG